MQSDDCSAVRDISSAMSLLLSSVHNDVSWKLEAEVFIGQMEAQGFPIGCITTLSPPPYIVKIVNEGLARTNSRLLYTNVC